MADRDDSSEGDDAVIVFDPDEPIVTFFFKLPEPVSVPEYSVFRERIHATALPLGWLERGTEAENVPGDRSLVNTWVFGSSIIVHQVKIGIAASLGLDAVMRAAIVGIKGRGDHDVPDIPDDLVVDGTVLEVALPAWVNLTVRQHQHSLNGQTTADVRDTEGLSGEQIDALFNLAIERVRHLQMAYHAVVNGPITLLTPEVLPPLIPYVVRKSEQIAAKETVELQLYMSQRAFNAITRGVDLTEDQVAEIYHASRQISHNPLAAYLDLDREAHVSLRRSGNTRLAVVMAAASAEVILDRTLLMMQWEEGKTPESVAANWRDSLKSRVEKDFAGRIGGVWDLTSDQPVGRWAKKVAQVRNRVVHGGYLPTFEEAEEAIATARELVTFICDRLASGGNLKKYTRSAVLLAGNDGLEKRGRRTNAVKRLQKDLSETAWAPTFGMWFRTFSRLRSDLLIPRQSTLEGATLLAVYFPGNWPKWVAHDDSTGQAVEVDVPVDVDLGLARESVNRKFAEHSQGEHRDNPISMAIVGGVPDGVNATGRWVEEYHLVPLRGVMVDWSDFTAPIT